MFTKEAVVLIGHGGSPSDIPRAVLGELKRLEGERQARGERKMSAREAELDRQVREWPRTPETDPYKSGVEQIARALAPKLGLRKLVIAYNEFCAPSLPEAVEALIKEGYLRIRLVSTMFTRGGVHAELEIPAFVREARQSHPGVEIDYAWPFEAGFIADFLAAQLERALPPRPDRTDPR